MPPLRALVVDDEQPARDELCFLLRQDGDVEIIGQAADGVAALRLAGELQPDVIFLDVQMPGLTGFEVARRLLEAKVPSQLVFVTAFDQYAIDAFSVNAVDYLLKPVDPGRLEMAVERARQRMSRAADSTEGTAVAGAPSLAGAVSDDQIEKIVRLVSERQSRREQIAVKVDERFLLVRAEEIIYASTTEEGISVVTAQYAGASNYRTLDELHARLDPGVFWRVHRSHLVNINKIKEIVPWFSRNYILRMKDAKATEIPVSRTQTKRLREYLKL